MRATGQTAQTDCTSAKILPMVTKRVTHILLGAHVTTTISIYTLSYIGDHTEIIKNPESMPIRLT